MLLANTERLHLLGGTSCYARQLTNKLEGANVKAKTQNPIKMRPEQGCTLT
jgi:hypothetical protein